MLEYGDNILLELRYSNILKFLGKMLLALLLNLPSGFMFIIMYDISFGIYILLIPFLLYFLLNIFSFVIIIHEKTTFILKFFDKILLFILLLTGGIIITPLGLSIIYFIIAIKINKSL